MEAMIEVIAVSVALIVFCILALLIYLAVKRWKTVSLIYAAFISIIIAHLLLVYLVIYFGYAIHLPGFLVRYAFWLLALVR